MELDTFHIDNLHHYMSGPIKVGSLVTYRVIDDWGFGIVVGSEYLYFDKVNSPSIFHILWSHFNLVA